jgi:hypothetical protein
MLATSRNFVPRLLRSRGATTALSRLCADQSITSQSFPFSPHTNVQSRRILSTTPSPITEDSDGPWGDLFHANVGPDLMGKTASIRRTFDARSNALGLLTCGGEALAKDASFDPEYHRARDWIRHHAVGPAVLSPVLISGLVGALVEAAVPQSVPHKCSMHQIRPLIVGVQVCAKIEVVAVADPEVTEHATACASDVDSRSSHHEDAYECTNCKNGFEVGLRTEVTRVRDGAKIAEGTHSIWIPDYLHM